MDGTMKHSPLPWSNCHNGECKCGQICHNDGPILTLFCADNTEQAEHWWGIPLPSKEEMTANAKFIVKAANAYTPMLKALEAVEKYFDDKEEGVIDARFEPALKLVEKALSKVKS